MTLRRTFIKNTRLLAGGIMVGIHSISKKSFSISSTNSLISERPVLGERKFTNSAVEQTILEIKNNVKNAELSWMFENCFPNTLDTTVKSRIENGKPYTYVIAGDIDAMWLRDSSAQGCPYLPLMKNNKPHVLQI